MLRALIIPLLATAPLGSRAEIGPDPTIRISLNSEGRYLPGDRVRVQVRTRDDGYVVVFQVDAEQRVRILFPLDPTDDNYVRGGKNYSILGRGGREGFVAEDGGSGTVFAAASQDPWRFESIVVNEHWDYRTLNANVFDDPEPQLVDLAQRLAGGRFEYDILPYNVLGSLAHGSTGVVVDDYYYEPTTAVAIGSCFGCGGWGTSISIGFGTGYWGHSYWGVYDPFFYDPWYWRSYYGPAWYPYNPWYGPVWGHGYGHGYGRGWDWGGGGWNYPTPYVTSPYQFKAGNRRWSGPNVPYRDRWSNGSLVATNTVAGQLPGTGVSQRVGFRNRNWSGGGSSFGSPVGASRPVNVPVSKTGGTSGRRVDPANKAGTFSGGRANGSATGRVSKDGGRHIDGGYVGPRRARPEDIQSKVPVSRPDRRDERPEARPSRTFGRGVEARPERPVPVSKSEPSGRQERAEPRRSEPQRSEPQRAEPQLRRSEPQRTERQRSEPQRAEPQRESRAPSRGFSDGGGRSGGGSMSAPPQGRSGGGGAQGGGGNRPSGGGGGGGGRRH